MSKTKPMFRHRNPRRDAAPATDTPIKANIFMSQADSTTIARAQGMYYHLTGRRMMLKELFARFGMTGIRLFSAKLAREMKRERTLVKAAAIGKAVQNGK